MSWRNLPAAEEARRRKLHRQGMTDKEIARAVGLSPSGISGWRRKRQLRANYRRQETEMNIRRRQMYEAGLSDREMAAREGVTVGAISNWRGLRYLPRQSRTGPRGTTETYPRENILFMQAFERDLLRAADRFEKRAPDIGSFLEAWRDDRASEVIEMIERGVLR